MTPEEALRQAREGALLPVYLVVGEERWLVEQVVSALRDAAVGGGPAGFNEERFVAGESRAEDVVHAARSLPMMAKRRFVLVRSLERWDKAKDEDGPAKEEAGKRKTPPLDALADYVAGQASPSTCLVLVADKLDARRRLVTAAKKGNFVVACEPLARGALPPWITRTAKAMGHGIDGETAELLAEIAGPELAHVADALERVGLYVGAGQPITEDAISACVVRMRQSTVWELVGALGRRDLGKSLAALADVYDPRDRGLRLLGVVAWSVRQLVKFESASRAGASPEEAAKRAGAPPFKARELAAQVKAIPRAELERWMGLLAETDLALKGSKRPPLAIVETMIVEMCGAR